jgi:hypothetical protein
MKTAAIITRRSSRINMKNSSLFDDNITRMHNIMHISLHDGLSRIERITYIKKMYDMFCDTFILSSTRTITHIKTSSPQSIPRLYKCAYMRISELLKEMSDIYIPKSKFYPFVKTLTRFSNLYKKYQAEQIYKAVLFSRVKIPRDVFVLVMEYYFTSPFYTFAH